jgi:hypothetical protein
MKVQFLVSVPARMGDDVNRVIEIPFDGIPYGDVVGAARLLTSVATILLRTPALVTVIE